MRPTEASRNAFICGREPPACSIRLRYRTSTGSDVLILAATSTTLAPCVQFPAVSGLSILAMSNGVNFRKTNHIRITSGPVNLRNQGERPGNGCRTIA